MGRDKYIIDPAEIDFDNVVADIEEIRKFNPQRFEMEPADGDRLCQRRRDALCWLQEYHP